MACQDFVENGGGYGSEDDFRAALIALLENRVIYQHDHWQGIDDLAKAFEEFIFVKMDTDSERGVMYLLDNDKIRKVVS